VKNVEKKVYKQDNGWIYDILTPIGDLLIHQDGKPAVGGTNGFATKVEAENIADLVVALIEADLPPSVTVAQVTAAKTLDIKGEIKAIKEAISEVKKELKTKSIQ
jgi:hypothetical protein